MSAGAIRCGECDGEGLFGVRGCSHQGNCPCGSEDEVCGHCEGTGCEPCSICRDEVASEVTADGDLACKRCALKAHDAARPGGLVGVA